MQSKSASMVRSRCPNAGMGMMEQRKKKVPVFLRQAIRQGIGVTIAVLLGYAIADTLGGTPLLMLCCSVNAHGQAEAHRNAVCSCQHIFHDTIRCSSVELARGERAITCFLCGLTLALQGTKGREECSGSRDASGQPSRSWSWHPPCWARCHR